jgi:hypothetical protein
MSLLPQANISTAMMVSTTGGHVMRRNPKLCLGIGGVLWCALQGRASLAIGGNQHVPELLLGQLAPVTEPVSLQIDFFAVTSLCHGTL